MPKLKKVTRTRNFYKPRKVTQLPKRIVRSIKHVHIKTKLRRIKRAQLLLRILSGVMTKQGEADMLEEIIMLKHPGLISRLQPQDFDFFSKEFEKTVKTPDNINSVMLAKFQAEIGDNKWKIFRKTLQKFNNPLATVIPSLYSIQHHISKNVLFPNSTPISTNNQTVGRFLDLRVLLTAFGTLLEEDDNLWTQVRFFPKAPNTFIWCLFIDASPQTKKTGSCFTLIQCWNWYNMIHCPTAMFLLGGCDGTESCDNMVTYAKSLDQQLKAVARKTYFIRGNAYRIEFRIKWDQKCAAIFKNQVGQAAFWFSPFVCANKDNVHKYIKDYKNCEWPARTYEERIKLGTLAQNKQQEFAHLTKSDDRFHSYCNAETKGQQGVPLLSICDHDYPDGLHNDCNGAKHYLKLLLEFSEQWNTHKQFIHELQNQGLELIASQSAIWILDKATKIRFVGNDVQTFFDHMWDLLKSLGMDNKTRQKRQVLAAIGYAFQKASELYNSRSATEESLLELEKYCKVYYNLHVHYFPSNYIKPTTFTIGYVIPTYARKLFEELGVGLGYASTQSGESKLGKLKKRQKALNFWKKSGKDKWLLLFNLEYIHYWWLAKQLGVSAVFQIPKTMERNPTKKSQITTCMICGQSELRNKLKHPCEFCTTVLHIVDEAAEGRFIFKFTQSK